MYTINADKNNFEIRTIFSDRKMFARYKNIKYSRDFLIFFIFCIILTVEILLVEGAIHFYIYNVFIFTKILILY